MSLATRLLGSVQSNISMSEKHCSKILNSKHAAAKAANDGLSTARLGMGMGMGNDHQHM